MKYKKRPARLLMLCLTLCLTFCLSLSACSDNTEWSYSGESELTVAILSSIYTYNALPGLDAGIELAKQDAEALYGVRLNVERYEDGARYDTAVSDARQVASDPKIAALISVQEFDEVDSVAGILSEKNKPMIVLSGCYDDTAEKGYDNVLFDFLSADKMGRLMGEYILDKGYGRTALLHTLTNFEIDEIKGLEAALDKTEAVICDIQSGPYIEADFKAALRKWQLLDVDSVFICFYDLGLGAEIINYLREHAPEIAIMGDYGLDNEETISACKDNLNGLVYPALFPARDSSTLTDFYARCQDLYGDGISYIYAAQLYDLLMMLTDRAVNGEPADSREYMELLKADEGYMGLIGLHRYNADNGQLMTDDKKYMIFNGSYFEPLDDQ